jgi:putative transposase
MCNAPIQIEQVIKGNVEETSASLRLEKESQEKRVRGRPKGSKNKNKKEIVLS